jgi:hypothetical protein
MCLKVFEDKDGKIRFPILTTELVPTGTWGANLRSLLPPSGWNRLRRWAYEQAEHKCEICEQDGFSQNRKHAVEAHELWSYDDVRHIQTLEGIQALCPLCHCVKHLGRSLKVGAAKQVREHMQEVNGWDAHTQKMYEDFSFLVHSLRSRFRWTVEIQDKLKEYLDMGVIKQKDYDTAIGRLKNGAYSEEKK